MFISPARRRTAAPFAPLLTLGGLAFVAACSGNQVRFEHTPPPAPILTGVEGTLFLLGDAGEPGAARDSVLAHLTRAIAVASSPSTEITVAFLGDNIYDDGARPQNLDTHRPKLAAQVEALGQDERVRGVFLPGNHDWKPGPNDGGLASLQLQRAWLEQLADPRRVGLVPGDGCPGPVGEDLSPSVRLLFLDTEWLLHEPVDECGGADGFYTRLTDEVARSIGRRIVVMAHHPLASGGPHGGNIGVFEKGPFFFYLARRAGLNRQDLGSSEYTRMRNRIEEAFTAAGTRPLAFATGHDHSLQVIAMEGSGAPLLQLVSGSSSKSNPATGIDGTRYATDGNGYMRLDFTAAETWLTVYAAPGKGASLERVFWCAISAEGEGDVCPSARRAGS